MLRRLTLRDFVIVEHLDLALGAGFSVLTGETGAGKSILIDAVQLALGGRGEASVVREGASRAEITAEFDLPSGTLPTGESVGAWLEAGGFDVGEDALLLKRSIDAQGRSRAWINGGAATIAQLRELANQLLDIHGQHAWQSLMRPDAVRALLDAYAGLPPNPLLTVWTAWREAQKNADNARQRQTENQQERERLQWQLGELDKLNFSSTPSASNEWRELNEEHARLAHAQSILEATQQALQNLHEGEVSANTLTTQAIAALDNVVAHDARLASIIDTLQNAQTQLEDAVHSLNAAWRHTDLDPQRLQTLDERLALWLGLARRWHCPPQDLPQLQMQWREKLDALHAAGDLDALTRGAQQAQMMYMDAAKRVSATRAEAAPRLAQAVTQAMHMLGMQGGRFEVELTPQESPQSYGVEGVDLLVAGHAGSTPKPLAKVASGGELSRISLALAVTTSRQSAGRANTLIFDEIDAGVGGAVAQTVGQLLQQLSLDCQVLAVTHLPQVAACADHHFIVSKITRNGVTTSAIQAVDGAARTHEIARMLGGATQSTLSVAHAQEMLNLQQNAMNAKAEP